MEKFKRIVALKNVSINEACLPGHFPQRPVMPGVLLLEALAQAAGLLAIVSFADAGDGQSLFYFGGIDAARFKRPVEPGDQLALDVRLMRHRAGVFKFKASGFVGSNLAVEAVLLSARAAFV